MSTNNVGQLTAEKLKALGAFVPSKPLPAPVDWNGTEIPLYVRRLSGCALFELSRVVNDEQRSYAASIIEKAVCFDPDGVEPFDFETAYKLVPGLMAKILAEVNKVNGGAIDGR